MKINEYIEITNEDNMLLMARYPDNYFDLAIVDPPYGIGAERPTQYGRKAIKYEIENNKWDIIPNKEYFEELFRVSKNQIIWGGNYFTNFLPPSMGWICWYKTNECKGRSWSEFELAYTSFNIRSKYYEQVPFIRGGKRIHPTQKPIELYEFCLLDYAKENYKILDTHLGSGSIAIALDNVNKMDKMNLTLTACELDKDYFESAAKRIKQVTKQQCLF